jgi:hypothetical protein
MIRRWTLPAVLALVACFSGGWLLQRRIGVGRDVYQQARLFEQVLQHVLDYHVDSLPEGELYRRSIDGLLTVFRDVMTAYALELRREGAVRVAAFQVDQPMRDEVRRRLEAWGVRMADSTYGGGARIVDQQLGYEVARYAFGPDVERRRRVADDAQIGQAVALLRHASTPGALLGLAGTPATSAH